MNQRILGADVRIVHRIRIRNERLVIETLESLLDVFLSASSDVLEGNAPSIFAVAAGLDGEIVLLAEQLIFSLATVATSLTLKNGGGRLVHDDGGLSF